MLEIYRARQEDDASIMIQRMWRGYKTRDDMLPPLVMVPYMQLPGMIHFHGMPTAIPDTLAYMNKYNNKN